MSSFEWNEHDDCVKKIGNMVSVVNVQYKSAMG